MLLCVGVCILICVCCCVCCACSDLCAAVCVCVGERPHDDGVVERIHRRPCLRIVKRIHDWPAAAGSERSGPHVCRGRHRRLPAAAAAAASLVQLADILHLLDPVLHILSLRSLQREHPFRAVCLFGPELEASSVRVLIRVGVIRDLHLGHRAGPALPGAGGRIGRILEILHGKN